LYSYSTKMDTTIIENIRHITSRNIITENNNAYIWDFQISNMSFIPDVMIVKSCNTYTDINTTAIFYITSSIVNNDVIATIKLDTQTLPNSTFRLHNQLIPNISFSLLRNNSNNILVTPNFVASDFTIEISLEIELIQFGRKTQSKHHV